MDGGASDREFRFFPLGLASRIVLAAGLFTAGAGLDLAFQGPLRLLGPALAVLGWFPLMLRPATNRPEDQGLEEWRPVSMAELDRLDESLRTSRKLRRKARSPSIASLAVPFAALAALALVVGLALEREDLVFAAGYGLVFLVPALFFGRVRIFLPKDIDFKLPSFKAALEEPWPQGVALVPYLRFDKDPAGRDIPEDLRLMLELKRPFEDFVGIQLQAAVNKGPNGEVPYLYAVILTKGRLGPSYRRACGIRARGFEIEPGGEGEYGTVVLRQATSGGGYYTSPEDCRRLTRLCYEFLVSLSAEDRGGLSIE